MLGSFVWDYREQFKSKQPICQKMTPCIKNIVSHRLNLYEGIGQACARAESAQMFREFREINDSDIGFRNTSISGPQRIRDPDS